MIVEYFPINLLKIILCYCNKNEYLLLSRTNKHLKKILESEENYASGLSINYVAKSLSLLKYAYDAGYELDKSICEYTDLNGNLEGLKYVREKRCPWDEKVCHYAAKNGHLECLRYAHENGCPWDEDTCMVAASN